MNDIIQKIKTSNFIDHPFEIRSPINNISAKKWRLIFKIITGSNDKRARVGTFNTPYNAVSNTDYKMPKLKFINDTLSDLYDARALEIIQNAKKTNRTIVVMWSGGIDSTSVLVSFLKHLKTNEVHLIKVILTTASILENFDFYRRYIHNTLKCINYTTLNLDNDFFTKHIILHGDPGNALFGPSQMMYRPFIQDQTYLKPWKEQYSQMQSHLDHLGQQVDNTIEDFGTWYIDKVTQTLEESGYADHVSSVADWWWWEYFNMSWEFSCQRPFFYLRYDSYAESISQENIKFYSQNVFFNTDKFQQWSYSNLKTLVGKDITKVKEEVKKYIYDFDKNQTYLSNKRVQGTFTPIRYKRLFYRKKVFYDQTWKGWDSNSIKNYSFLFGMLLEKFKG